MKTLTIKIYYGGLGDHLLHSHLPRIAKQKFGYDKVFISNKSNYNNPNTKRLVWEYNPFVDGFNDEDHDYPKFGSVPSGANILDGVSMFYGLDDGERMVEPEVYYKPKFIQEFQNAVIFEPNHSNAYGIPTLEQAEKYFRVNGINITHQMKWLCKFNTPTMPEISTCGLEEFCDVITSCKEFYCFTSGGATLASALGKSATVMYIDGINPMFHHSKLHKYVKVA